MTPVKIFLFALVAFVAFVHVTSTPAGIIWGLQDVSEPESKFPGLPNNAQREGRIIWGVENNADREGRIIWGVENNADREGRIIWGVENPGHDVGPTLKVRH